MGKAEPLCFGASVLLFLGVIAEIFHFQSYIFFLLALLLIFIGIISDD